MATQENNQKTIQDILGVKGTLSFGVELTSSPAAMRDEFRPWQAANPGGIVAYRVYGDKTFSERSVKNGIIGNPFNWTKVGGEEKATRMFYEWLHTGNNFGEPMASESLRKAIVDKLTATESGTKILYYKDIGKPSHATVLGYFVEHKDQLAISVKANKTDDGAVSRVQDSSSPSSIQIDKLSAYQLEKILRDIRFPQAGVNAMFDEASAAIDEAIAPGWRMGKTPEQAKEHLLSTYNSLPEEVQKYIMDETTGVSLFAGNFEGKKCDVYTVGFSTKTLFDLRAAIPPETEIVIDIRNWPYNNYQPQFNKNALGDELKKQGIDVMYIPEKSENFIESLREVILKNPGKVIIASSESKPSKSTRGQTIGPLLEQSGISVGHITQGFDDKTKTWMVKPNLTTQEELTNTMLALKRKEIANGSYRSVSFNEKGDIILGQDVALRDIPKKEWADRRIAGQWNHNTMVTVKESDRKSDRSALWDAVRDVESQSNIVFAITKNKKIHTAEDRRTLDALMSAPGDTSGGRYVAVNFPEEFVALRHELSDDLAVGKISTAQMDKRLTEFVSEHIRKNRIDDKIGRIVLAQQMADPENFDAMSMTAGFVGANLPSLRNRASDGKPTEDEYQMTPTMIMEGYHVMSESADIEQEDVTAFGKHFLLALKEAAVSKGSPIEDDQEEKNPLYDISKTVCLGETGIGLGFAEASQELHFDVTLQAMRFGEHTIDNETLSGRKVKDIVSLTNHLHQGAHSAPSMDELAAQIDHVAEQGEINLAGGLTDRQLLVLSEFGFKNSDLLLMAEQASNNKMFIVREPVVLDDSTVRETIAPGLLELIDLCAGYGLEVPESLDTERIVGAEMSVEALLDRASLEGIGVMTVANPLYPETLRASEGYTAVTESEQYVVEDGVAHASIVREEVKEEHPAILFFKGNIEALQGDSLAVVSDMLSTDQSKRAAENIGRTLGENDINIATAFRHTQNVSHDVKIDTSKTLGSAVDKELQEKDIKISVARTDAASVATDAAIRAGSAAIILSPNGLAFQQDADRIRTVVENGGLVLSPITPFHKEMVGEGEDKGLKLVPTKEGSEMDFQRCGHFICSFAGRAILLEGRAEGERNSPADEVRMAKDGVYAVRFDGMGDEYKYQGNLNALQNGAEAIDPSGMDLASCIERVKFSSQEKSAEGAKETIQKEETKAIERQEMHVDNYPFKVVRRGTDQVFIVPENYPDVRDAVRRAYGDEARFAENISITKMNISAHERMVESEPVRVFSGYSGTQPMEEPVYTQSLFYNHGEIFSLYNAPDNVGGLISQKKRLQNKELLEGFISEIDKVRQEFNKSLSLPLDSTFLFVNAEYVTASPVGIELHEGPRLALSVGLMSNGSWMVRCPESLRNDLYNDFFVANPYGDSEEAVVGRQKDLNGNRTFEATIVDERALTRILNSDAAMSEKKKALDELAKTIRDRLMDADGLGENLDKAEKDIKEGISQGLLSLHGTESYGVAVAVASITAEEKKLATEFRSLKREEGKLEKQFKDASAERDKAYGESLAPSEYRAVDERLDAIEQERVSLSGKINATLEKIGALQEQREKVILCRSLSVSKIENEGHKNECVTLCADGFPVVVYPGKLSAKTPWTEINKLISDISENARKSKELFMAGNEKIENNTATLESVGKNFDLRNESGKYGVANKNEVVPGSFRYGRFIVERDGKMAYADERLNIRSEFYDKLMPWGGRIGLAFRDGKQNYIDAAGKPKVEMWYDSRTKTKEGLFIIKVGEEYGIIGSEGKLIGGRLFANARDCNDGWCVVQGSASDPEFPGKFNYVNAEGKTLYANKGLDEASDFKDGVADIVYSGKKGKIGKDGKKVPSKAIGAPALPTPPAPSAKGKGGRK